MLTRMLGSMVLAMLVAGLGVGVGAGPAVGAEGSCADGSSPTRVKVKQADDTFIWESRCADGSKPGAGGTGPKNDNAGGVGTGPAKCYFHDEELPCTGPNDSTWNGRCYRGSALPEASQGPGPDGEEYPEEGRWHVCYVAPGVDWVGSCLPSDDHGVCVWVPAGSPAAVSPVDVAWLAIAQMTLSPIEVGIVPKSGEDRFGLVGLPTWMWVADASESSWGPVSASASDGPVSVSATARARQVFWDMGDGNVVVCGKGVPYDPAFGIEESPNCGHRYERTSVDQPDQAYQVTATTQWVVEWSGGGMTGVIEFDLVSDPVPVRVGEMQVLLQ